MAKKEQNSERYIVGAIPTQTENVIVDNETQKQYNIEMGIAVILNKLDKIEKSVVG